MSVGYWGAHAYCSVVQLLLGFAMHMPSEAVDDGCLASLARDRAAPS